MRMARGRLVGWAFGVAAALAGPVPSVAGQTGGLLEADRAVAKRSEECGFACGLGSALTDRVFYLHNGVPVIYGAASVRAFLQVQDTLLSHRIQWQPLDARVSADGTFGITWGVTAVALRGGPVRFGRYITAWQQDGGMWRIAAHLQTALNDAAQVSGPDRGAVTPLPPLPSGPAVSAFIEADRTFAAQGGREGPAAAFAAWAAPDAVVFGPSEVVRGPAAIREYFTGPPSQWTWGPVGAGGSADGSLGFTVGEATIRLTRPDGREVTSRSKYLTIWTKQADGSIRYLVDAGNGR